MKSNKRLHKKRKYTKRRKVGGHKHEDVPHYHLLIQSPRGMIYEMSEQFLNTHLDRNIDAATINNIYQFVIDRDINNGKPFTLFWKGKRLADLNVKLRKIVVNGEKLPVYKHKKDPIVVIYNKDIGDPEWFEAHDIDWTDPNTPR